jgi:hypothetical protein
MPVQGKRRYVDEETGQFVEGTNSFLSHLEKRLGLNSPVVRQITTTFLQTTSARRTRRHSSFYKWPMHGRRPGRPVSPAAVPGVAVAVAVHYQGSPQRGTTVKIAGPVPVLTVVQTNPWTRTWRVWRARRATHNWPRIHGPRDMLVLNMLHAVSFVPHDDRAVVPKREHLINSTIFGR